MNAVPEFCEDMAALTGSRGGVCVILRKKDCGAAAGYGILLVSNRKVRFGMRTKDRPGAAGDEGLA